MATRQLLPGSTPGRLAASADEAEAHGEWPAGGGNGRDEHVECIEGELIEPEPEPEPPMLRVVQSSKAAPRARRHTDVTVVVSVDTADRVQVATAAGDAEPPSSAAAALLDLNRAALPAGPRAMPHHKVVACYAAHARR